MKKGMQVKIIRNRHQRVYRHTSHEEQQEWYEKLNAACRAGLDVGYDCAGESKLAPRCAVVEAKDSDIFTVVRGRCCPTIGWHSQPKSALIRNNRTGEEGYIRRVHLEIV